MGGAVADELFQTCVVGFLQYDVVAVGRDVLADVGGFGDGL